MFEECIECLVSAGRTDEAKNLLEKRMKISEVPKLLCIYGDLYNDYKAYKKVLFILYMYLNLCFLHIKIYNFILIIRRGYYQIKNMLKHKEH